MVFDVSRFGRAIGRAERAVRNANLTRDAFYEMGPVRNESYASFITRQYENGVNELKIAKDSLDKTKQSLKTYERKKFRYEAATENLHRTRIAVLGRLTEDATYAERKAKELISGSEKTVDGDKYREAMNALGRALDTSLPCALRISQGNEKPELQIKPQIEEIKLLQQQLESRFPPGTRKHKPSSDYSPGPLW